jgi:hypothetical protein
MEWHLSADMKTIKCMYRLKHGANNKHSCIYYMQERSKPDVGTNESAAQASRRKGKTRWHNGLFAEHVEAKPVDLEDHNRWKPVLPIPLTRVHIYTLHALVQMSAKILHLYFMFVWNMQNQVQKDSAIIDMEKSLLAIGVHGGNVQICIDPQLSGAHNSIPRKPSLNGVVANRLFQPSTWSGKDRVWKDVYESEHNFMEQGRSRIARVDMWKAFEDIQPYLTGLTLTLEQRSSFKEKVEAFGRLYTAAFGEEHVTHYMVSCFIHCFILLTYISFKLENSRIILFHMSCSMHPPYFH